MKNFMSRNCIAFWKLSETNIGILDLKKKVIYQKCSNSWNFGRIWLVNELVLTFWSVPKYIPIWGFSKIIVTTDNNPRWKFPTGFVPRQYRSTSTGTAPKGNLAGSCPSVLARYWTSVPCQHWNLYWFSTGITPKSVVSQNLVSGLGIYYASTATTRQPLARYQLSSTGIAPSLQLARYCAICKYYTERKY